MARCEVTWSPRTPEKVTWPKFLRFVRSEPFQRKRWVFFVTQFNLWEPGYKLGGKRQVLILVYICCSRFFFWLAGSAFSRCVPRPCLLVKFEVTFLSKMPESLTSVLSKCYEEYTNNTSKKLKLIDAYLAYIMLTGIMQFVYCCLVGTFPFNSFLSGFISCVGSFVLAGKYFDTL